MKLRLRNWHQPQYAHQEPGAGKQRRAGPPGRNATVRWGNMEPGVARIAIWLTAPYLREVLFATGGVSVLRS